LATAIIANFAANTFNWLTWYDFINKWQAAGFKKTIKELPLEAMIFLFIVYPLILGLSVYLTQKILKNSGN